MNAIKIKITLVLLFCIGNLYSQIFLSGEEPAHLKWQQINTENFQIVFPEGFEKQAQYMANALEQAYKYSRTTLKSEPRKISVLLHNQTVISNGNAAWAPARINAYTLPPQDSFAQNWLEQLAIHEFRHIVQIERMNTGLTKIFGLLFGQTAAVTMTGTYLPWWFIEGDAVVTETALSNTGRGRLPSFEMPVKAQLIEKGVYNYEKATHGSYKDFTPNVYELGYQIVAYGRTKYGANMWDTAVENAARKPLLFNSFSSGIKKTTGLSKREFYAESMDFLKNKWQKIYEQTETSDFQSVTKETKKYTNYLNPVFISEDEFIAFKSEIDDLTKIVSVDTFGNEKLLLTPGLSYLESLSVGGSFLCWAEIESDIRWSNRSFSVIKLFDLQTQKKISLTKRTRHFSPQINGEGSKIVAVKVTPENIYSLDILEVTNGTILKNIQFKDNAFIMHPTWSADGRQIVMTILTEKGKNIRVYNLENGQWKDVLDFSFVEISRPKLIDGRIIFNASYSGIDNLYAYDLKTEEISQLTSVKFGVGNYDVRNNKIIFSNYSSDGFVIAVQKIKKENETPIKDIQINAFSFAEKLAAQEKGVVDVKQDDLKSYPVSKYSKGKHLFNFHSWAPLAFDFDAYSAQPGISLMSQNLLSTAITTLGYEYDMDEKWGKYFLNFTYRGWYPIIDLNVEFEPRRDYFRVLDEEGNYVETINFKVDQLETSLGISLPLSFSKNSYVSGLTPFVRIANVNQFHPDDYPEIYAEDAYQKLEVGFNFYHYKRSSRNDLYPKWGLIGRTRYINTSFTNFNTSDLIAAEGIFYIPGMLKHHGIRLYTGAQLRTFGTYNSDNVISFNRGVSRPALEDLYRFSVDYKFPLCYPDIDLGSILYIKRLSMTLFYDYSYGIHPEYKQNFHSLGAQLNMRTHVLSFMTPVNWGMRYVYIPDLNDYSFYVFFSIDFSSLY